MTRESRKGPIEAIQELRPGRVLVTLMTFDRNSNPGVPGLSTQFASDAKGPLFRVLKESVTDDAHVDLFLYTRGGDTNAVWPIVSLIREFDEDFEILVPFRCHSAGTLLCLGANRVVVGPISELSPIDPTTANQFNPSDPNDGNKKLGISVEDVTQYTDFVMQTIGPELTAHGGDGPGLQASLAEMLGHLSSSVHPLALGNVHRALKQIKALAKSLLSLHAGDLDEDKLKGITTRLASTLYSHLHMINRSEAQDILGPERIVFAEPALADAMDALLGQYRKDFRLWKSFHLNRFMGDEPRKEANFVGGVVESKDWSYLDRTDVEVWQQSAIPPNVQVQVPPGQSMPLVQGLPRTYRMDIMSQGWERNADPRGVTLE